MSNAIKEIVRFQKDRLLDKQEYVPANEFTNIAEEMIESMGISVPKEKRQELNEHFQSFVVNFITKVLEKEDVELTENKDEVVDAYADIVVFCVGAIMKLGYKPECVLKEVAKEINSRTGEIVDGKFQKDTSPEAKAKWYKADFSKCK